MSRRVVLVDRDILRIEQRTRSPRVEIGTDISGPACIYAHVRVARGRVVYLHGGERILAPACFELFLPPFAVVQASLERCDVTSIGFAFLAPPSAELPRDPVLRAAAPDDVPGSQDDVIRRLRRMKAAVAVPRERDPVRVARTAKSALDREYASALTIARVAARAGVSPAVLSRTFRAAYGVPPVRYRHQVRIMDALMRFAAGGVPAEVFLDVGFEDLSRFYKVFRKVACAAPGSYRPPESGPESRNAKT